MQSKLQLEEAEISTLKQQAAAVAVMAAGQQHPAAACAMMGATAANGVAAGAAGTSAAALDSGCVVELPTAPEPGSSSTGVVVEQGIEQGCLYVKVGRVVGCLGSVRAMSRITAAACTPRTGLVMGAHTRITTAVAADCHNRTGQLQGPQGAAV
jgi:hypothetical protein